MNALNLYPVQNIDMLAWPNTPIFDLNTPAIQIFTDFTQHEPQVIQSTTRAIDAERLMKQAHVKMKLVLDDKGLFVGILSASDISADKIMRKVSKDNPRDQLKVRDFMQSRQQLMSFAWDELQHATVADVLETQSKNHTQHCLVIDTHNHHIRGVISARDIARQLKRAVNIEQHISFAHLFDEFAIEQALNPN